MMIRDLIRNLTRWLLLGIGIIFLGLSSLMLLLSSKQIHKNQLQFADMQDLVAAVEKFELKNNRVPTKHEFTNLLVGLPIRYPEAYEFASSPEECHVQIAGGWPKAPGWVIYYWRGEWYEYYSSWNKQNTLAEQATWWGFCGPLLFCPLVAGLFIGCSFLPVLKRKKSSSV